MAAYTQDERELSWLQEADETVCIGPVPIYLDQDAILQSQQRTRLLTPHPGWAFSPGEPSSRCGAVGVRFIGPPAHLIRSMGDKIEARRSMKALN